MGFNDRHYFDYRDIKSGERMRAEFVLPGAAALAAATAPEWGAAATSGYLHLGFSEGDADYAIMSIPSVGEAAFEAGVHLGMSQTPTATVGFRLDRFDEVGAERMRTDLIAVGQTGFASSTYSSSISGTSDDIDIRVAPVLTIYSDKGESGRTIAQFDVVFQGVQQKFPTRKLTLNRKKKSCYYEVQFLHIGRYVLQQITPANVSANALRNYNTTTYVGGNASEDYAYSFFYDNIWTDGGKVYGISAGVRGATENRIAARLMKTGVLTRSIEDLAEQTYRVIVRDNSATFAFVKSLGSESYSGDGTPFDFLAFKIRDSAYDETNAGSVGTNPAGDYYFVAAGWEDARSANAPTIASSELYDKYDADEIVLGLFAPADQWGIHTYANCWDLVVDMVGGGICTGTFLADPISGTPGRDLLLIFAPLGTPFKNDANIKANDVIGDDVEFEVGANIVREVQCEVPDANGDDVSPVAKRPTDAGLADRDMGVGLFFHNTPYLGSIDEFRAMTHGATNGAKNDDFTNSSDYMCGVYDTISPRRLYEFSDAGGLMNYQVPLLVHNQGSINDGIVGSPSTYGTTVALPTPGEPSAFLYGESLSEIDNWFRTYFIELYRDTVFIVQRQSGLGYGASEILQEIFSNKHQWKTTVDVRSSLADLTNLGGRFRLTNESNGAAALDIFTQDSGYLGKDIYPSHGYCVGVSVVDGTTSLTLVGVPT